MTEDWMESLAGQKFLVTGGAGVIAAEMLTRLSAARAEVLSIDRLPLPTAPGGVEHLVGDLATMDLGAIVRFRPKHILHLAATFERSVESPEFWVENWNDNVVVTHRLVELAESKAPLETFVFASSYLVYDPSLYLISSPPAGATTLDESARLRPRNLCGAAKLYAEAEIEFMRGQRRLPFRAAHARIFRSYGRGSRDVVSRWVRAALSGDEVQFYQLESQFDYVFAGDVAEGLLRILASPSAEGVINLASGTARPVSAVVDAIEAATGTRLEGAQLEVDGPYEASQADVSRLRAATGWSPPTDLETGVRRIANFERTTRS